MKILTTSLLWLLAALPFLAAQSPLDTESQQNRVLALENAWNLAEEHKDAKALDELLSSSLIYIDYDGSLMDKGQFLASIREPALHPEQIVNESMTVHLFGDAAVVTGVYREKGVANGKPYLRRGRFTDTWVNQKGTWQCVASQSTLISH